MITMLLGGLWHGANWTFVVWGAYHGTLLCVYRRFAHRWDRLPRASSQLMMFVLAIIGWVFFRSTTFSMAWSLLEKMFVPVRGEPLEGLGGLVTLLWLAAWWAMRGPNAFDMHVEWQFRPRHAIALALAYGACMAVMAGGGSSPFLYFQF
jgi:alginate O-acetyltransferase complex protein AlgI